MERLATWKILVPTLRLSNDPLAALRAVRPDPGGYSWSVPGPAADTELPPCCQTATLPRRHRITRFADLSDSSDEGKERSTASGLKESARLAVYVLATIEPRHRCHGRRDTSSCSAETYVLQLTNRHNRFSTSPRHVLSYVLQLTNRHSLPKRPIICLAKCLGRCS